VTWPIGYIY